MGISESYASPGLRWGLLLEDHPGAKYEFTLAKGSDFPENPIPAEFGGDRSYCLCSISFPPASGKSQVYAYKPSGESGDPDTWNVICTKTLGRALKKAGYPDDLKDLKALLLWRQRTAETAAIAAGSFHGEIGAAHPAPAEIGPGQRPEPKSIEAALDDAAQSTPTGQSVDDDTVDAVLVDDDDDRVALIRELVDGLTDREYENYKGFLDTIKAPNDPGEMTAQQVDDVLAWLDPGDD
jgi:hypothetical protein